MAFIDESTSSLSLKELAKNQVACYFALGVGVVVDGYKKLFELSDTKIVLLLLDGKKLQLAGEKMIIKELSVSEITITGSVQSITVL